MRGYGWEEKEGKEEATACAPTSVGTRRRHDATRRRSNKGWTPQERAVSERTHPFTSTCSRPPVVCAVGVVYGTIAHVNACPPTSTTVAVLLLDGMVYVECSARWGIGVRRLLQEAVACALLGLVSHTIVS